MTMTEKERTITKHELSAVLLAIDIKVSAMKDVMDAAFPPPFTPKKGEIIWTSVLGDSYTLRVFSNMGNGEYVCFEDSHEENRFYYKYAKPQTPTQKGEN
jgi:hypothetical protein